MRRRLAFLLLFGFASACTNPMSPAPSVAGTWSEQFSIPGASLVLRLDASGNGDGTYAIEAGRSGTVHVTGLSDIRNITLSIRYDYGLLRTFTGTLTDDTHLTGVFNDATGTVVFIRAT
jgi:hypothetical protein